ncbi:hypothetical protein ACLEEJ_00395 [Lonsdalea quercina]|uniref:hypothetical protein n=1 Tax=Lonsdalea quercina TaxID=71657 RepID=UPI0039765CA3
MDDKKKLPLSSNYSEHHIDFAIIGKGLNDTYCLQLISNKPFPTIKSVDSKDSLSKKVEIEMESFLTHECSIYMGEKEMIAMKESIDNAMGDKDKS